MQVDSALESKDTIHTASHSWTEVADCPTKPCHNSVECAHMRSGIREFEDRLMTTLKL